MIDANDNAIKEMLVEHKHDYDNIILNKDNKGYALKKSVCNKAYVIPLLASYTTAMARVKMYPNLIKYKPFYTDSVSKNSLINTHYDDITIEDYWNNQYDSIIYDRDKEFKKCNIPILTCDGTKNLYVVPKMIIRHKINKELIKVYLTNNEYIECTDNHSLIDKNMNSIPSNELKVGCKILVCSKIPHKIKKSLNGFSNYDFELMGHIIGNGNILNQRDSLLPNYISLSSKYIHTIIEKIINPIQDKYKFKITYKSKPTDIIINCSELARKYYDYGIKGNSYTKVVPNSLYYESKENIIAFIKGYFNADGSISIREDNPIIKVDSINKELLQGIRKLLRIVGIAHSYFEENKKTSYNGKKSKYNMKRINILDKSEFLKVIGFNTGCDDRYFKLNKEKRNLNEDYKGRRIIKIEKIMYNDYVYDFSIDKYEKFYANNILCHNTDCLFTKYEVPSSSKLGEFKLEKEVKRAVLVKPKFYMIDEKTKVKGINRMNVKMFQDLLMKRKISYDKFTKFKESVRQNILPNTKVDAVKQLDLEDTKREWYRPFDAYSFDEISTPWNRTFKVK
jgi:intein/homing endonuclease